MPSSSEGDIPLLTGAEAIVEINRVGHICPEEGQKLLARLGVALIMAEERVAYLEGALERTQPYFELRRLFRYLTGKPR